MSASRKDGESMDQNVIHLLIQEAKARGDTEVRSWSGTEKDIKTQRLRKELDIDMENPFEDGEETRKRQVRGPIPVPPSPAKKRNMVHSGRNTNVAESYASVVQLSPSITVPAVEPSPVPSERILNAAHALVSMAAAGEAMDADEYEEQGGAPAVPPQQLEEEPMPQAPPPSPPRRAPVAVPPPPQPIQTQNDEFVAFLKDRVSQLEAEKKSIEAEKKEVEVNNIELTEKMAVLSYIAEEKQKIEAEKKALEAEKVDLSIKVAVLTYVSEEKKRVDAEKKELQIEKKELLAEKKAAEARATELQVEAADLKAKQGMYKFLLEDNQKVYVDMVKSKDAHIADTKAIAQERYNDTYNLMADTIKEKQETIDGMLTKRRGRPPQGL